jgi:hypothetical protein
MENGVAFRLHPKEGIVHSSRDKRGWTPPSTGWAKLNTDIGFCIGEHWGCGSVHEWQSHTISVEVAESYSLDRGDKSGSLLGRASLDTRVDLVFDMCENRL